MQVPRGQFSVLWSLEKGELTAAEAMIYLCLNHGSSWNSGATWCLSGPYLSKMLGTGMSRSYVQKTIAGLTDKGWIEISNKDNPSGYRYMVQHHLCAPEEVPVNKNDKPLKFTVPRGPGGPLERCFEGEISWKASLVWIVLKRRSNWKAYEDTAGQTERATLLSLSRRCRIKHATFQKIITELEQAGMLYRLTPKSQKAVFQLYPKPLPKPVQSAPASRETSTPAKPIESEPASRETATPAKPPAKPIESEPTPPAPKRREREKDPVWDGEGYFNEEFYYSRNYEYRCHRKTGQIQQRTEMQWKGISDYHRGQVMNPAIIEYFERKVFTRSVPCLYSL